jgi:choline dehydrogenase-like flavoprotein
VANVLMLGAGLGGLSTAMLLARDGHQVTVLERDLAEPPPAARAWEAWERRGVNQFHLPHFMLPRWRLQMEREVPEVLDELGAAGGLRINCIGMFPRRGAAPCGTATSASRPSPPAGPHSRRPSPPWPAARPGSGSGAVSP